MKTDKPKYLNDGLFRIGLTSQLPPYLYSQGYVFNILNFAGLCAALIRIIYLAFSDQLNSYSEIIFNTAPLLGCLVMMLTMHLRAYVFTVYFSFLVMPPVIFFGGVYTNDRSLFLYLLLYLVYSFFFLNSKKKIFLAFAMSVAYFIAALSLELLQTETHASGHKHDPALELISLAGVVVLAFLSMYSIKFQVWRYQEKIRQQRNELETARRVMADQNQKLEQSNLVKDKLFSIISHDLKTPLMSISVLLEAETDTDTSAAIIKEILPELKSEIRKTSELFDNLLKWARIQIREATIANVPVNISELTYKVTDSLQTKASEKGVTIHTSVSNTFINADKDVLEIVLRNLVTNAIKFTETNDSITISGCRIQNGFAIDVTDTGRGIQPDVLDKIKGTSFYSSPGTRNEKGTGLGLIICRDLIEKCSGQLLIESEAGAGTKVSIRIPQ